MRKLNVLELFAGSRSFSKEAEARGHKTYCSDIKDFEGVNQVCDIFKFDVNKVGFVPDIIWASCPCQAFSVASIGANWTGGKQAYIPKTAKAILGIEIVKKTLEIIEHFKKINPSLIWIIENPRGILRKLDLIPTETINTAWYCQYGDLRAKPTDIFSNINEGILPISLDYWNAKTCKNGNKNCHHEPAPRGSRTGTQGLKGNYERSIVPKQLCEDLLMKIETKLLFREVI